MQCDSNNVCVSAQEFPIDPRGDSFTHKAWYGENAHDELYTVAQKRPNSDNLYDLFGNISQICIHTVDDHNGSLEVGYGGDTDMTEEECRDSYETGLMGLRIVRRI